MRVIVTGSRGWSDRYFIADVLADLPGDTVIVHGAAKGVDKVAAQEAQKLGLLIEEHPAEWERYGKSAGIIRNEKMACLGADLCIAFWDGRSRGTQDMMERAAAHGIPIECVHRDFPNRERRRISECVAAN
jgi:hypothetical protein